MEEKSTRENAVVVGIFDDTYQAGRAIAELSQLGFGEGQVDFAMTEASTFAENITGDVPAYRESESGQAIVRLRPGDRHQEVVDLLHRYGALDVHAEYDESGLISPGNVRDYGSPGEHTVGMGAAGDPSGYDTWERARPYYQSRWRQQYVTAGRRWEDYEPAYRFGWERSRMPDYRGRSWSEVEPGLRSDWEQGHNLSPWDRIVDAVRDTWENLTGRQDRTSVDRAA